MKPGIYQMKSADYHAAPGINSTALSSFLEGPDAALMPREAKSYFSIGNAFELLVEDRAKGTNKFAAQFFYALTNGALPEKLIQWVESGEDLTDKYVYTGGGALSKTYKTLHSYLDECIERPGLMPLGIGDAAMLSTMVDNFFKMEVQVQPVGDILKAAKFQTAIFWEDDFGNLKKALYDVLVEGKGMAHIFDIKSSVNKSQFSTMLNNKYWVQGAHYQEGAASFFGDSTPMTFLASYKTKPYLAQPAGIDEQSREQAKEEYQTLVENYVEWTNSGRPSKGWLPYYEQKLWFNK